MIRRWVTLEQEVSKLADLINQGTDQDLVDVLQACSPDHIRWSVSHVSATGDTTLHLAAVRERLAGLRVMLHSQADPNGRDGKGRSPLHTCLCHNSLSSARLLVSFGANVNETVCRQTRESLLHRMVKANRPMAVELLLEMGASLRAVTKDGDTPLHFAARYNRLKIARFLTLMGAGVNATNLQQETPLHVAIASHSLDVAKFLLKNKASVTVKDKQGMTSLHLAVTASHLELVRLILETNSTQVNSKESTLGRTPLLLACSGNCPKTVALLLMFGADTTLTTFYRKSALHVAATSGSPNVLKTILRSSSNPNLLATNNQTSLHCAAVRGHAGIVKVLLGAGVRVDMKDMDGNTALHLAAQAGHNDIINVLLQHGSQVNPTNMMQQTPLHLASIAGHSKTCSLLVNAGCDQNILDLHEMKADSYLDKYVCTHDKQMSTTIGIKGEVTGVRFHNTGSVHFQEIQESMASDAGIENEGFNRNNPLQQRPSRRDDGNVHVLHSLATQMSLNSQSQINKTADTTNGDCLTKECSIHVRFNCQPPTAESTNINSCEEHSHDEQNDSQNSEVSCTRHLKSKARKSKRMNNKPSRSQTTKIHSHGNGGDNDDIIKQEDTDHRKRKQGVTL